MAWNSESRQSFPRFIAWFAINPHLMSHKISLTVIPAGIKQPIPYDYDTELAVLVHGGLLGTPPATPRTMGNFLLNSNFTKFNRILTFLLLYLSLGVMGN